MPEIKNMANNKNPPVCEMPDLSKCDLQKGKDGLEYPKQRTKENPFFAIATGALHGGPIKYDAQQKHVERISKLDPKDMTHQDFNEDILKGKGVQYWQTRANALTDAARCYQKHCKNGGKSCLREPKRNKLMNCIAITTRGIGQKTRDLMLEYLGDQNAVAVDRHVMNYVCNIKGVCYPGKQKGKPITAKQYSEIKKEVRKIARSEGITPAHLQVAIWLKEACKAHVKVQRKTTMWLGEGKTVNCCEEQQCLNID